ncbi:hypothetical protein E5843_09170 [Luteimonas yindakuii]|uniref:hypothetical protein n=1 Tax=Luteimonas yindakuii TaxID=2565782 RepID=UPI00110769A0|nr:hypothetical protein [Luteimonas yindakuii]QCO67889.2 hypothetical protein E5843_09170 [Luteimonas yindakuii]
MKSTALVLATLIQACAVSESPDAPSPVASDASVTSGHGRSDIRSKDHRGGSCFSALAGAEDIDEEQRLSAFRTFNNYPPSQGKAALDDVDLASIPARTPGLSSCLEDSHFSFKVLVDGVLTEGAPSQMHPLTAWRIHQGYLVFFLHKNYEVVDGEGETVEISALALDASGTSVQSLPAVSSWYEYEGSIRIRDFAYLNHRFVTTEEIFDPLERDESGIVLTYQEVPRNKRFSGYEIDFAQKQ